MPLAALLPIRRGTGTVEYATTVPDLGVSYVPVSYDTMPDDSPVTRDVAEGLPGVGRGVEIIAGVLSQLTPRLYRSEALTSTPTVQVDPPPLLRDPDPGWHGLPGWLYALVSDLVWDGNAFALRAPETVDWRGYPLRLPLIPPDVVSWDGTGYVVAGADGPRPVDVLHAAVHTRSGRRMGRGILARHQGALRLIRATEGSQYVLMRQNRPAGILASDRDLTPAEAAAAKAAVIDALTSSSLAVVSSAKYQPVQWSADDLSMIPTREYHLRLAADITGVPPYMLGVPSEARVYSNAEQEWANFLRLCAGLYLPAVESMLSACYPRDLTVRLDVDGLLRADASTRWQVWETASRIGAVTVDEIRQAEGRPPLDTADGSAP